MGRNEGDEMESMIKLSNYLASNFNLSRKSLINYRDNFF